MRTFIFSIATIILISVPLFSLAMANDTLQPPPTHHSSGDLQDNKTDRPAEISSPDNWINRALLSESVTWQEIDHWYRNKLPLLKDQPDYYNQKSMAIGGMIVAKKFLEEANYDELIFYTKEMIEDDNVLGNVKEVTKMLKTAAEINPREEKEVAQLAEMAESKYRDHYRARSIEEKEAYVERYHQSFMTLADLQSD